MEKSDFKYKDSKRISEEELNLEMSTDEKNAIAYAAAKTKEVLGNMPEKAVVEVSRNILKNAENLTMSDTDYLKGIEAITAAGIILGETENVLEAIQKISKEDKERIKEYLESHKIEVKYADTQFIFDIQVNFYYGDSCAKVRIVNYYTNIVLIEKDNDILFIKEANVLNEFNEEISSNLDESIDFGDSIDIEDIRDIIENNKR